MVLYLGIAVLTVALAGIMRIEPGDKLSGRSGISWGISRGRMLNGAVLVTIFLVLFGVAAARLNVGNDYAKYVDFMHLVVSNAYVPTEPGFNGLVRLVFAVSGYENFLLVFALFAGATVALFLAAIYRQSGNFFFSFFLFMAFGYYFQSFSTVRYYLAAALALYCIPFVIRKEWLRFILLILLGATFHKSLLVVIPLYFLASLPWKRWSLLLAAAFCTTFFFMQNFYLQVMVLLYPTYEGTEYLEGGTSYVNIIRCGGILVFSLRYYRQAVDGNRRNRFYFYCNLGALVLYTCCSFIPVISRIGYYLTVTHIFFLPALVGGIENKRQKRIFTVMIAGAAILYFAVYMMRAGDDGVRILPYQTFLFHDMPPIQSEVN